MTSQQPSARLRPFKPVQFGRYTLVAQLATGGMGEIYLARMEGPQGFEKFCVIKKILPHLASEPDFVERFVNEAKTLVKLTHGSIAQVLDMGLHEGDPYIALEHVDGKDLRKVAARQRERALPPPLTFVLYVMSRVLDALAYAHRKRDELDKELNLVHRDISPQNILVSYEGEVKIIDFGLAKSTLSAAKTNPSIILGKFLYMSPEQARHQKVDRRSDLYSVGLCLWELVAGKHPFDDAPSGELMARVANPEIPTLHSRDPLVSTAVSQMVAKALAIDPAQRFQTAEEFRGRLLSALLEIDQTAGPETVSKFMRDTFTAEYQAERRLLQSLKEAARPGRSETTQIVREPVEAEVKQLPRRGPAKEKEPEPRLQVFTQPETPAFSASPTPPPQSLPERRPLPRRDHSDLVTEHDIPVISDEPVMGVLLDDPTGLETPRLSPDSSVITHPDMPAVRRAPAPLAAAPRAPKRPSVAGYGVPTTVDKTDELDLNQVTAPRRRASATWIALPLVLVTVAGGAYYVWDLHRAGLFQETHKPAVEHAPVAPPPAPPTPTLPAVPKAAAPSTPPKTEADDLLVPLSTAPARKAPPRRRSRRETTLTREWTRTRLAFEDLERSRSCDLPSMKLLCGRYETLKSEVVAAEGNAVSEEKLLPRVHSLAQLIAQKKAAER